MEVVDFIILSVGHILKNRIWSDLGSKGVHIIDPFTGTGTFITRLSVKRPDQPGRAETQIPKRNSRERTCCWLYYIAAINIEAVYHGIVGGDYQPFEGICLTDTFQMYEKEDLHDQMLAKNSDRRKKQKALDIRVDIGQSAVFGRTEKRER